MILPPKGHLVMSGDIFDCQNWYVLASNQQRPGMLLTSHNTKVIPNNEELPGPKVNTAEVKTLVFSNQTFPSYYFIKHLLLRLSMTYVTLSSLHFQTLFLHDFTSVNNRKPILSSLRHPPFTCLPRFCVLLVSLLTLATTQSPPWTHTINSAFKTEIPQDSVGLVTLYSLLRQAH